MPAQYYKSIMSKQMTKKKEEKSSRKWYKCDELPIKKPALFPLGKKVSCFCEAYTTASSCKADNCPSSITSCGS